MPSASDFSRRRYATDFAGMVHSTVLTRAHQMAPHPYARPVAPNWRKLSNVARKRKPNYLDDEKPLIGLIPKTGVPSLSIEAINRIQLLVEPKFPFIAPGINAVDNTPRAYLDMTCSESDRKKKILDFLKDENGISVKLEDVADEDYLDNTQSDSGFDMHMETNNFSPPTLSNQQVFPELSVIETGAETQVVYKPPAECSSPLWKLEEMKEQLPAVKEQSKDFPGNIVGPDSPSSASSTGSSKDGDDDRGSKRPFIKYDGIGQIQLWQFLLQCLVKGTHGISWTNQDAYEFQFTHPEAIARAWGECKPKMKMMTYDKMSRSLRGYYKSKTLMKVPNHRYVYKFLKEEIKKICREMQKSNE